MARRKKKSDNELFEEEFPPFFNDWFNSNWPRVHWNNALSQWRMMKRVAWEAYQFARSWDSPYSDY